jgi:hypothetical protein
MQEAHTAVERGGEGSIARHPRGHGDYSEMNGFPRGTSSGNNSFHKNFKGPSKFAMAFILRSVMSFDLKALVLMNCD